MNKLSKYMYGVGGGIVLLSIIRWFIIYYDPSQAILGVAIGIIVLGFADIYNERKYVQERLDEDKDYFQKEINKLNKRCDAIVNWYTKGELE